MEIYVHKLKKSMAIRMSETPHWPLALNKAASSWFIHYKIINWMGRHFRGLVELLNMKRRKEQSSRHRGLWVQLVYPFMDSYYLDPPDAINEILNFLAF